MARTRMLLPSIDGKTKQKTRILELSLYSRNGSDNHATRISNRVPAHWQRSL